MILPRQPLGRAIFAPDRAPRAWRVGWWVFWAATLWSAVLLVADLPPGTYVPPLIFAVLLSLVLVPTLLVGTLLGIRTAWIGREWISIAPLMPWALTWTLAAGTLGTVGGDLPERIAFGLSSDALDALVEEALALPEEVQYVDEEPRRVGLYLVDEIRRTGSTRVRCVVLGTRLFGVQHGLMWVASEADLPTRSSYRIEPHVRVEDETGRGWYRFELEL